MNITIVNETLGHASLARQIGEALDVSRTLVAAIEDEAGMRLFLDIDAKIADCLKELDIPLKKKYLATDSTETIMEHIAMRITFVLGACRDLREFDPARADKLLADLAAAAQGVQVKLQVLNDPEWNVPENWGN